ncbi:MAG TPA: aldehyde dehydrogenase family protein, partial [Gammaproteobacteria bacterium]|nr:aldehyde dehydrogenase family protein [Gammaproteobacteria bacterium]
MTFLSIDPASSERLQEYPAWGPERLEQALSAAAAAAPAWGARPIEERCARMRRAGELLLQRRDEYALLMSREMGKVLAEAQAEVEKSARACLYYADEAPRMLADEVVKTDAKRSLVAYQPLGTVLAIMPWNFPFWQVIRAAAPALTAGNSLLLKHADNVYGSALALEAVFHDAGFPAGVFQTLMIHVPEVDAVIRDARVAAVTLTGSERAGVAVGRAAGETLKKCVLEL